MTDPSLESPSLISWELIPFEWIDLDAAYLDYLYRKRLEQTKTACVGAGCSARAVSPSLTNVGFDGDRRPSRMDAYCDSRETDAASGNRD